MATDYSVKLKAQLDTSDVQQKLQQLGQTGANATQQMDRAVQNLDHSMKSLASSIERVGQQQSRLALKMASTYVGSKVLGSAADKAEDGSAVALRGAQGALQGAQMGAAGGSIGIAAGAAIGALNSALEELNKQAKAAADSVWGAAQAQAGNIVKWRNAKEQVEFQQRLRGVTADQAGGLRSKAEEARRQYESFMTGDLGKSWAESYTGSVDDFTKDRENMRLKLQKEMQTSELLAKQAEKLASERDRQIKAAEAEADATKKAAQAEADRKERELKSDLQTRQGMRLGFQKQERMEAFGNWLENASPTELMEQKNRLQELQEKYKAQFLAYSSTGEGGDTEAARQALEDYNEITQKLKAVEGVLGGMGGEGGLSFSDQMQALGSEAQKGYDVGGYGSLDQQMLNIEKETKDAVQKSATTLNSINTKLDEVKNAINSGTVVGVYG